MYASRAASSWVIPQFNDGTLLDSKDDSDSMILTREEGGFIRDACVSFLMM